MEIKEMITKITQEVKKRLRQKEIALVGEYYRYSYEVPKEKQNLVVRVVDTENDYVVCVTEENVILQIPKEDFFYDYQLHNFVLTLKPILYALSKEDIAIEFGEKLREISFDLSDKKCVDLIFDCLCVKPNTGYIVGKKIKHKRPEIYKNTLIDTIKRNLIGFIDEKYGVVLGFYAERDNDSSYPYKVISFDDNYVRYIEILNFVKKDIVHHKSYIQDFKNKFKLYNTLIYREYIAEFIITFQKPHPSKALHRTEKSIECLEWLIKTYSNENEVVLDNTCGSGTTAIACLNTNRKYICIDNSEHYIKITEQRIKDWNKR